MAEGDAGRSLALSGDERMNGLSMRFVDLTIARAMARAFAAVCLALWALASTAMPASAQELEFLGTFRDWHAFKFLENGNPVCYIATRPTREEGNYSRRGDVYLMVTHRPAENSRDVVSVITGYTYEPGSEVRAVIADQTFDLFTEDDTAWARDAETDNAIVQAMIRGVSLTVRGRSNRGTDTNDAYSLRGFTAARDEINEACG